MLLATYLLSPHFRKGKAQERVRHCEIVVNLERAARQLRPQKKATEAL